MDLRRFNTKKSLKDTMLANLEAYWIEEINTEEFIAQEGKILTQIGVIDLFEEISSGKNDKYYVGITGRVREREKEHNAVFLAVIDCQSLDKANDLEELAKANGFYTGGATGNGHEEDTTKLYIYKMIPGVTIEG